MAGELCEDKSRRMISSAGFCYSDVSSGNQTIQSHMENQIQGFDSNSEIFNSTAGIEMIGFSRNQQQNTDGWKGFLGKAISQPGPSRMMNESTGDYYFTKPDFTASGGSEGSRENNFMATAAWQENRLLVDESNSFRCVFPCEGNERPSQGLSLSLSSSNPSSIALQSFELRQAHHQGQHDDHTVRFDTASTSRDIQQQQHMMQGGPMSRSSNFYHHGQFQLRDSKYLSPAQELLNEFCSLGIKYNDPPKQKADKSKLSDQDEEHGSSSSFRRQPLHTLDFMELQKRKAKLLSMLEEVDKRYRHYRDQMKAVASSFESVAGTGSASVYTALASKAMSKHFRCLRDAIVDQIQAIKKAMGDKDQAVPGTSRGETPRLRALDQVFRQQRAMQQMSMLESHPWRPQRGLPERSVSILRAWLFEHFLHPYPTDVDKHILARQTGLSRSQVSNWFINARVRLWKPMVEEMYIEEFKEQENTSSSGKAQDEEGQPPRENPHDQEQKPSQEQLVQIDSQCLSSIIPQKNDDRNNKTISQNHNNMHSQQNQSFGRVGETFGVIDLDFSSYNNQNPGGTVSYTNDQSVNHNFNGGGNGGVSLTLGLQQQGGNIAFSPTSQSSLFYSRDHIEDCQPVQYSLLDGEGQNLPYRNLIGAQILHDLA